MPLISILLPVYNAAPFLETCLQSLLQQSEANWELLAIDDFSDDESWSILRLAAKKDPRIQVFKNKEKGIIPALRLAFAKSKGALISRMDADDWMESDKLTCLKEALINTGKGHIATAQVAYFSDTELGGGYARYEKWINGLREDRFHDIYKECVIPSPCWMVWREDLLACKAFEPATYPEDYDLCFRFYQRQLKVISLPKVLHYWRDHSNRTSRTDVNYADQAYLDLKLSYFTRLDYQLKRPLWLWGAGQKGKRIARYFIDKDLPFQWICNNPNKWGKDIYGKQLTSYTHLDVAQNPILVIAVAGPADQEEIKRYLRQEGLKKGEHYYFFC